MTKTLQNKKNKISYLEEQLEKVQNEVQEKSNLERDLKMQLECEKSRFEEKIKEKDAKINEDHKTHEKLNVEIQRLKVV